VHGNIGALEDSEMFAIGDDVDYEVLRVP